jgi:putative ABC transport system ATP-binding protein
MSALAEKELTRVRRDRIGFIFQSFNLIPTLDAYENITLPMALGGHDPDADWVAKVIATVGLQDRLKHRPSELSGGQQQRVAVARALASRPEVIFADEPTGNLDSKSSGDILDFMQRAVKEFNQTIVMVTHDPHAASYADRVVFLVDGRVVDQIVSPTADAVLDFMRKLGE